MSGSTEIAFIVPAYNVEPYLNDSLSSIIEASRAGDQLILVDDGSRDDTTRLCHEWQSRYPDLIHLIVQENQGLSAARNNALVQVRTKYVLFMDSDDAVNPQAVSLARQVLKTHRPDVLTMDFYWWYPHQQGRMVRSPRCSHPARELLFDCTQFMIDTYRDALLSACSRFFRTELLQQLAPEVFPRGKTYEELATVPRLIMRAKSMYYLDEPLFNYRVREGSITRSKTLRHCVDMVTALRTSNLELQTQNTRQAERLASNMASARFLAKALQDCGEVPAANLVTYQQVMQAGLATFTLPLDEVIAALKTSDWHSARKAAKHLSQATRHMYLYVLSRTLLMRWRRLRSQCS